MRGPEHPPDELEAPSPQPGNNSARALAFYGSTIAATYVFLMPLMRLWRADPRVPFSYESDAMFNGVLFRSMIDYGWYENNPRMGAPFGAQMHDFPFADNLHLVLARLLALFTDEYGTLLNLYFLAGFGLVALAAAWVFRRLGLGRPVSVVLAVLFTLAPYHFVRGEIHLFLATYFSVPPAALLLVLALRGERLGGRPLRLVGVVAAALLVGASSTYYAIFTVILLVPATILAVVRVRRRAAAAFGTVALLLVTAAALANLMPDILYARQHGLNDAARRQAGETEYYSLKLAHLVLPIEGHRIGALADARERYQTTFPLPSEGAAVALGAVATAGFVWLLAVPALVLAGRRELDDRHKELSTLTLLAVGVATAGGLSSLVGLFGFSKIRAWNRMSIFVAFFALASLGILIERGLERTRGHPRARVVSAVALGSLLLFGVYDQTSDRYVPPYDRNRVNFVSDEAFVRAVERSLPKGAAVFQMPYLPFPEAGPREQMQDYDHVRGYVHSEHLRWSYGDVKGRPDTDWQEATNGASAAVLVPGLAAAGFEAVYVDRFAYADRAAALEGAIGSLVGGPVVVSSDGRFSLFTLGRVRDGMDRAVAEALRQRVLRPTRVRFGRGFSGDGPPEIGREAREGATLDVTQPGPSPRSLTIRFTLRTASPAAATVAIRIGNEAVERYRIEGGALDVVLHRTLGPGVHPIRIEWGQPRSGGPSPDDGGLTVVSPHVEDADLARFAQSALR